MLSPYHRWEVACRAARNLADSGALWCEGSMSQAIAFSGSERRRHRVYVTRNTEYHFRDGLCVAVRDRNSGEFLHGHLALRRRVQGTLKRFPNGALVPHVGEPQTGDSLFFLTGGRDLVTSPVQDIARPSREVTQAYSDVAGEDDTFFASASDDDGDADFFP
jgi:hypothetical protein